MDSVEYREQLENRRDERGRSAESAARTVPVAPLEALLERGRVGRLVAGTQSRARRAVRPLDVPALTGAFLAGAAAAATVRWWWPRLERIDGRVQAWWEARHVDVLVRDRIRTPHDDQPDPDDQEAAA